MSRWDWDAEPEDRGDASYIFDKEMGCLVKIREGSNTPPPEIRRPMDGVMRDLPDYLAVGMVDHKKGPGHPLWIGGGRRQHRDELRARGAIEVGNEKTGWSEPPKMAPAGPVVREALAKHGFYDGARTMKELRKQQFRGR